MLRMSNVKRPAARPATAQRQAHLLHSPELPSEIEKCDEIVSEIEKFDKIVSESGSGIEIEMEPPPHPPQKSRTRLFPWLWSLAPSDRDTQERAAHRQHCCSI